MTSTNPFTRAREALELASSQHSATVEVVGQDLADELDILYTEAANAMSDLLVTQAAIKQLTAMTAEGKATWPSAFQVTLNHDEARDMAVRSLDRMLALLDLHTGHLTTLES